MFVTCRDHRGTIIHFVASKVLYLEGTPYGQNGRVFFAEDTSIDLHPSENLEDIRDKIDKALMEVHSFR